MPQQVCTWISFRNVHELCLDAYIKYVYIYTTHMKYVKICTWSMFIYVHKVCLDVYMKYVCKMYIKYV